MQSFFGHFPASEFFNTHRRLHSKIPAHALTLPCPARRHHTRTPPHLKIHTSPLRAPRAPPAIRRDLDARELSCDEPI